MLPEEKANARGFGFDNEGFESNIGFSRSSQNTFEEQKQAQMKRDLELEIVKEREKQIRQLESDILDINSMFKDVALMVHDQGEILSCFIFYF